MLFEVVSVECYEPSLLRKQGFSFHASLCFHRQCLAATLNSREKVRDVKVELGLWKPSYSIHGLVVLYFGQDRVSCLEIWTVRICPTHLALVSSASTFGSLASMSGSRLDRMQIHLDCHQAPMLRRVH